MQEDKDHKFKPTMTSSSYTWVSQQEPRDWSLMQYLKITKDTHTPLFLSDPPSPSPPTTSPVPSFDSDDDEFLSFFEYPDIDMSFLPPITNDHPSLIVRPSSPTPPDDSFLAFLVCHEDISDI